MDPASYLFRYDKVDKRLAETDADIVEVIHTNGNRFGFKQPLGTIDYYPNGGMSQPSCLWSIGCSHRRAYAFFIESINNPEFYAHRCDSLEDLQRNNCTNLSEVQKMGGEPGEAVM